MARMPRLFVLDIFYPGLRAISKLSPNPRVAATRPRNIRRVCSSVRIAEAAIIGICRRRIKAQQKVWYLNMPTGFG